ncbi:MAG TPA: GMC family oxidoreductase N-terminal domain-containing protein [Thermoanaerobaculia bacterium]|nr:GMC family oxidoreductase N-terminal domain-containing protein [Thermoanaerobaculia bacterium]
MPLLSPAERRTLELVCEAFLPALAPEAGDDPTLFALDAAALGVPGAMEETIGALGAGQQGELRQLLGLLATPVLPLLLTGRAKRFSAMDQEERERLLLAMANSRLPLLRTGFQALKRLATFLFYSLPTATGVNPAWPAIGYAPSTRPPARPVPLRLTAVTAPTNFECDVCVIGSGAGGGVVAAELAAAGRKVLVLEAGAGLQAPDFDQLELPALQRLYLDAGLTASRDLGMAILAGGALGGGTTVNWQTSLPLPDDVRAEWAERSGCGHFTRESFSRSLAAVLARLNAGTAESLINSSNATLRDGCTVAGHRWTTIPRNAKGCDLEQCGYCTFGCRLGGKQSSAVTWLADAQRDGGAEIVVQCRAERVLWQGGRVTGVEAVATEDSGRRHVVKVTAPIVVVAAGGIHSPALLLRSGPALPALGRNLYLHPAGSIAGTYEHPIETWKGAPQTVLCDEFARLAGPYGFRLETAPAHPGLMALATPWFGAREHRREMQGSAHKSTWVILVRDRTGGRVRVGKDGKPIVEYRPDPEAHAHLRQGAATAARLHLAAGAREVLGLNSRPHQLRAGASQAAIDAFCDRLAASPLDRNRSPIFSAHQMGTCRMGSDARSAVCDENGQVFGVRGLFIGDASAFPASSGVNPMITIMALAHHTAQRIEAGA